VPIHLWTTVEPLGHVWILSQGTGTADRADRVYTWLRTVESDLTPLNIGLTTAYRWTQNRQARRTLVGTAASSTGQATRWWWWWWWWWRTGIGKLT